MEKMEQTEKIEKNEKIEKSAAPKRQAKNSDLTFEEALKRLEEIVSLLNSGNAPLDKSLAMFEEGTALVRFCTGKLDAAEKKVKILTGLDKTPEEADFDPKKG